MIYTAIDNQLGHRGIYIYIYIIMWLTFDLTHKSSHKFLF
jgi:hypothetical protein